MEPIIPMEQWPLSLLLDYVIKIHHHGEAAQWEAILDLLPQVKSSSDWAAHNELQEIALQFEQSVGSLHQHFDKEENVLYNYIYRLCDAHEAHMAIEPFHCGTIRMPIMMMMQEHAEEIERYAHLADITDGFTAPQDASEPYKQLLAALKTFVADLTAHTNLENDIIFPKALQLEQETFNQV